MQELLPPALRGEGTVIAPIGIGMSGAGVYRVEANGAAYVLKVLPPSTPADWRRKVAVQELAAAAGIAPRVVHVDEEKRAIVSELVADRGLMPKLFDPATRAATIGELGTALRHLHDISPPPDVPAADPLAFLRVIGAALDGLALPTFVRTQLDAMRAETPPPSDRALVLSHNDVNPTNLAFDGERIVLLDWDTAALNEPLYDLAALAVFLRFDEAACLALLSAHDGAPVTSLPARFAYDRRLIGTLCGCVMLNMALRFGWPGGEVPIESAPTLPDVYLGMRTGQLSVRAPDGQWAFGLALVRSAVNATSS